MVEARSVTRIVTTKGGLIRFGASPNGVFNSLLGWRNVVLISNEDLQIKGEVINHDTSKCDALGGV